MIYILFICLWNMLWLKKTDMPGLFWTTVRSPASFKEDLPATRETFIKACCGSVFIFILLRKLMGKSWVFSAQDAILCQNGRMPYYYWQYYHHYYYYYYYDSHCCYVITIIIFLTNKSKILKFTIKRKKVHNKTV